MEITYEDIIQTVSEIVENNKIYKTGLTLIYKLSEERHRKLDEHLYCKANPTGIGFVHQNVIELEIGGIMIKFIKEGTTVHYENLQN